MRRLFIRTSSSDEHYNADCSFAVIEVTHELLALIEQRQSLIGGMIDSALAHVAWWDYSAFFIEDAEAYDTLEAVYGERPRNLILDGSWVEPPGLAPHPFEALSTDMDRMFMDAVGVWWKCAPKHTSISLETDRITIRVLLEMRKEL